MEEKRWSGAPASIPLASSENKSTHTRRHTHHNAYWLLENQREREKLMTKNEKACEFLGARKNQLLPGYFICAGSMRWCIRVCGIFSSTPACKSLCALTAVDDGQLPPFH
jgi:hypothetical protein